MKNNIISYFLKSNGIKNKIFKNIEKEFKFALKHKDAIYSEIDLVLHDLKKSGKFIYNDGSCIEVFHLKNGRPHRLDGPALEDSTGEKEYWVNGNFYEKEDYPEAVEKYKVQQYLKENNLEIIK